MPPAASTLSACFSSLRMFSTPPSHLRSFTTTPIFQKPKKRYRNPFAAARAARVKAANLKRQQELAEARATNAADPVKGHETPFLQQIEAIPSSWPSVDAVKEGATINPVDANRLNHFLKPDELPAFLDAAKELVTPRGTPDDPYVDDAELKGVEKDHPKAVEAIRRIVALGNGSSADRTRANTQYCIDLFGRHNTDTTLPKDPGALESNSNSMPRAGPDTGSSEVQAAILTVKIRTLVKQLENGGNKDKHNKRNLRLMVHRRQKILKYLKRKEKGGVRWRNVMEALGLDDAAIQKELFL